MPILSLKGITKNFPGVKALNDISIDFFAGEVHGLVGENGAGKSTLIKILTGAHSPDTGELFFKNKKVLLTNPREAMQMCINAIYQELNIVSHLTVTENVFLGREIRLPGVLGGLGLLDKTAMNSRTRELLTELGESINPDENIGRLGIGQQQMVEIAKALSVQTKILLMDEPTSSLSNREVESLLKTVKEIRARGIAVIYISHRMDEIAELCDRITILRDGCKVRTVLRDELTMDQIICSMVGRDIEKQYPHRNKNIREHKMIEVLNLRRKGVFEDVSFYIRSGEILGMAGLVGAGRTEVARAIFGADKLDGGKIIVDGKETKISSPRDAIDASLAFLTEDRKGQGLILGNTVDFNMNLALINKGRKYKINLLPLGRLKEKTRANVAKLQLNPPFPEFVTRQLSGGNQQKVVIAKWLNTEAKIFIFDEPTRGIDVGAKVEVYNVMNELAERGAAILMISSELPEIIGMSDRVVVMHEGSLITELPVEEATQEKIMFAAAGGLE